MQCTDVRRREQRVPPRDSVEDAGGQMRDADLPAHLVTRDAVACAPADDIRDARTTLAHRERSRIARRDPDGPLAGGIRLERKVRT